MHINKDKDADTDIFGKDSDTPIQICEFYGSSLEHYPKVFIKRLDAKIGSILQYVDSQCNI